MDSKALERLRLDLSKNFFPMIHDPRNSRDDDYREVVIWSLNKDQDFVDELVIAVSSAIYDRRCDVLVSPSYNGRCCLPHVFSICAEKYFVSSNTS